MMDFHILTLFPEMVMQGLHSYYRMVEETVIDAIVKHINEKMGVDVLRLIKEDLR